MEQLAARYLKLLSRGRVLWNNDIQEISERTMRWIERKSKQTGETPEQFLERFVIEKTEGEQEEVIEANLGEIEIVRKNTLDYYIYPNNASMSSIRNLRMGYL